MTADVALPEGLRTPALVVVAGAVLVPPADGVTVVPLGAELPVADWASVTLVAADETALRRAVSGLPALPAAAALGRSRTIGVVVREAVGPVTLVPRQEWPTVVDLDARVQPSGAAVTTVRFAGAPVVADVLVELARSSGTPVWAGGGGLFGAGALGAPVDPVSTNRDVPPTVVAPGTEPPATTITVQPPVAVPPELAEPPLDEALVNPRGFVRSWDEPVVDLDPHWQPTAALVAALRRLQGVRVGTGAPERLVAALAMAGVPLVGGAFGEPDLDDPLEREQHSVRVRRAALDRHSVPAWRSRLAGHAGVRVAGHPRVVLVAPEGALDSARELVAGQRGAEVGVEISVAPAGAPLAGDVVVLLTGAEGWWGPETILDLLRARRYSGAEVVESPAELVHLQERSTTVRRRVRTEVPVAEVLHDSLLLIERPLLALAGTVERALAAGATAYRTHGLSHVTRGSGPVPDVVREWPTLRLPAV